MRYFYDMVIRRLGQFWFWTDNDAISGNNLVKCNNNFISSEKSYLFLQKLPHTLSHIEDDDIKIGPFHLRPIGYPFF